MLFFLIALMTLMLGCQSESNEQMIELKEIELTTPEDWQVIFYGREEAQMKVPGDSIDFDYLNVSIRENSNFDVPQLKSLKEKENVIVYERECKDLYRCFYLKVEDTLYNVDFQISSTEIPPANADESWRPNVNVETDKIVDFLLTARPSKD